MSPSFVNDKAHRVTTTDNDGKSVRLRAGQVVDADGAYADRLQGLGLPTASDDDRERYESSRRRKRGGEGSRRLAAKRALAPARSALRALTTVAPLQVVIGDDQAPYGPPTGTITTKQALAQESEEGRKAFADGEAIPGDVVADGQTPDTRLAQQPTGVEVHNAQEQASRVAQAAAESHLEGHQGVAPAADEALDAIAPKKSKAKAAKPAEG